MSVIRYNTTHATREVNGHDQPMAVCDLIRLLPTGASGIKYAVVLVNYFTKWVAAEPLKSITTGKMVKFCYKNIVCCHGILHKIISDNAL